MNDLFYDLDAKPITIEQYHELKLLAANKRTVDKSGDSSPDDDPTRIGSDRVAGPWGADAWVSTTWLGLNHNYGDGPPLIFETMIFGGDYDEHCWRWPTKEAALAGHDRIVAALREGSLRARRAGSDLYPAPPGHRDAACRLVLRLRPRAARHDDRAVRIRPRPPTSCRVPAPLLLHPTTQRRGRRVVLGICLGMGGYGLEEEGVVSIERVIETFVYDRVEGDEPVTAERGIPLYVVSGAPVVDLPLAVSDERPVTIRNLDGGAVIIRAEEPIFGPDHGPSGVREFPLAARNAKVALVSDDDHWYLTSGRRVGYIDGEWTVGGGGCFLTAVPLTDDDIPGTTLHQGGTDGAAS